MIFRLAKKILPRISETEMIALKSGTVSLDGKIMHGKVEQNFHKNYENEDHQYLKYVDDNIKRTLDIFKEIIHKICQIPSYLFHVCRKILRK